MFINNLSYFLMLNLEIKILIRISFKQTKSWLLVWRKRYSIRIILLNFVLLEKSRFYRDFLEKSYSFWPGKIYFTSQPIYILFFIIYLIYFCIVKTAFMNFLLYFYKINVRHLIKWLANKLNFAQNFFSNSIVYCLSIFKNNLGRQIGLFAELFFSNSIVYCSSIFKNNIPLSCVE